MAITAAEVTAGARSMFAACKGSSLLIELKQTFMSVLDRSVSIQITNRSKKYILTNPQVYTYSGYCYHPPQPTVKNGVTEICSFTKTSGAVCGAVGVLTYDIADQHRKPYECLAIMFSVPYDYNTFVNTFALGFFKPGYPCDESLYKLMYESDGSFKKMETYGSENSYRGKKCTVKGTMTPTQKSVMKIELWDV